MEVPMTQRWQGDTARNPDEVPGQEGVGPDQPLAPGDDPSGTAGGGYGSGSGASSGGTGDGEAGGDAAGLGAGMDDGTSSAGTGAAGEGPTRWLRGEKVASPRADSDPGD
jgi:hypothetical protein